jgi:serine/threonine protein kinase/Tol biopolymer transport system component
MGEVYRARDTRLGRDVALKVLPTAFASDSDRLRRFEQEARAAGSINHPNILVLHDVGTRGETPYLVTELLEGETLRSRLREGALSPRKAIEYAQEIARGLAAAHQRGLAHRDLKPENIFILHDGRVKILDFGIAKFTQPDRSASGGEHSGAPIPTRLTATQSVDTDPGTVMGSAGYMAPEQVRGQPADHRSDIFALGAILYEMLSGRRAFQGETNAETMTAILRDEPPELDRDGRPLPAALDRIVRHCLEKSPSERFQSASDVAFALQSLSGISDSGPKLSVARSRFPRVILAPLAAVLLIALGAAAGRLLSGSGGTSPIDYRKLTFRRGLLCFARFSSDGHTVYYGASWDGKSPRIYSTDLDNPGAVDVGAPDSSVFLAISRSNEMAILIRVRVLPHDLWMGTLARMTPGGAPREVLDDVTAADWSADGSRLAVIHVVSGRYRVEYPIGTIRYQSPGWVSHLRISPDGRSVAFLEHPVFPDDRGFVMIADGTAEPRALGTTYSSIQGLAWAPGGNEVLFAGASRGNSRSILAVDRAGHVRTVTSLPNPGQMQDLAKTGDALIVTENVSIGIMARGPGEQKERDFSWLDWSIPGSISRDDRNLLFDEEGEGGGDHYATYIRGFDGSPPIRLGEGGAEDISPDGKWALALQFWTKPPQVVLLPTGVGEPRIIPVPELENIDHAKFFSSGTRLLLVGNEPGHSVRAYVRDLAGGTMRAVTPEGALVRFGELSPDDKWVPAILPSGEGKLYAAEGNEQRDLPRLLPRETFVGWSSDSRGVFVTVPAMNPMTVTRLDIETGKRTTLVTYSGPPDSSDNSPSPPILGHDDHTYAYTYGRDFSELFLARGMR